MNEVAKTTQEQTVFVAMDQAEELELFDAMVAGQTQIATYVYHIPIKTKSGVRDVYGLSLPGCTAALRAKCAKRVQSGGPAYDLQFETTEDRYDEGRDAWLCEVQIKDRTTGMIGVGRVYQPMFFDSRRQHPNQFADRIAFSKAKRNAIRDFLDEEFIKMMVELFVQQGRMREVDAAKFRANHVQKLIAKTEYEPEPKKTNGHGARTDPMTELKKLFDAHGIDHDKGWAALKKIRADIGPDNIDWSDVEEAKRRLEANGKTKAGKLI